MRGNVGRFQRRNANFNPLQGLDYNIGDDAVPFSKNIRRPGADVATRGCWADARSRARRFT